MTSMNIRQLGRRMGLLAILLLPFMLAPAATRSAAAQTKQHVLLTDGTGSFSGSADCHNFSGVFVDLWTSARFEDGNFDRGHATATIYQVDGSVADLRGPNRITLNQGDIRGPLVNLVGQFVSPLNNGTYCVEVQGVIKLHKGTIFSVCPCP